MPPLTFLGAPWKCALGGTLLPADSCYAAVLLEEDWVGTPVLAGGHCAHHFTRAVGSAPTTLPCLLTIIPWSMAGWAKAHHHKSQPMILMIAPMKYPYYTKLWPLCLILMKYHVDEGMESQVCQWNDKEREHGNVVRVPIFLCLVLMVYLMVRTGVTVVLWSIM